MLPSVSQLQNKSAGSIAKQPPSPKTTTTNSQVKNTVASRSSKSPGCSNKLKKLTVYSPKSTSSKKKSCDRSETSKNTSKTIALPSESSRNIAKEIDHEAVTKR